jgi:hypothetical protein
MWEKNDYYYSFKSQLRGHSRTKTRSLVDARVMGRVDPRQHKNKNCYYYNFKTQFDGQFRAKPGARVMLTVDSGQHKDKSDYYHSFKIWLNVDSRLRLGSRVRMVNLVDLIKHKIKMIIIIVLKPDSIVKLGKLQVTRVNLGPCKHKSYYHSF